MFIVDFISQISDEELSEGSDSDSSNVFQSQEKLQLFVYEEEDVVPNKGNALNVFFKRSNSELNGIKICAYSQVPQYISLIDQQQFHQDLFCTLLKQCCTSSQIVFEQIQGKMPSVEVLLQQSDEVAIEISKLYEEYYYGANINDQEMIYIIKQIIIERSTEIFESLYEIQKKKDRSSIQNLKTCCDICIQYVCPLLLASIKSSVCKKQIDCVYNQLKEIIKKFVNMFPKKYRAFEKTNKQQYQIQNTLEYNKSTEFQKEMSELHKIFDSFMNIIATQFFIIPYLKTQIFSYKNQIDNEIVLKLFQFKAFDKNQILQNEKLLFLNEKTFPIEDGYEVLLDATDSDADYQLQLLQNEYKNYDIIALPQQQIIINSSIEIAKYFAPKIVLIMVVLLTRQMANRPFHSKFIASIIESLSDFLIITKHDQQNTFNNKLCGELQKLRNSQTDYSLRFQQTIQLDQFQNVIVSLCKLITLTKHELTKINCNDIVNEFLAFLLDQNFNNNYQILSFCIPSILQLMDSKQQKDICSYFYDNIQNPKLNYSIIKNIGAFIQVSSENTQEYVKELLLNQKYKDLVDFSYYLLTFQSEQTNTLIMYFKQQFNCISEYFLTYNIFYALQIIKMKHTISNTDERVIINKQLLHLFDSKYKLILYQQFLVADMNNFLNLESQNIILRHMQEDEQIYDISMVSTMLKNNNLSKYIFQNLHDILLSIYLNISQYMCPSNKCKLFILKKEIQLQISANFLNQSIKYTAPSTNRKKQQQYWVAQCKSFKTRLSFADVLPEYIYYFCKQEKTELPLIQLLDIVLSLMYDPVRKIRTTFARKLGVMIGFLLNDQISLVYTIQILQTLVGVPNICNELDQIFKFVVVKSVQMQCLVIRIIFFIIQTAIKNPFEQIKSILQYLASSQQVMVVSTLAENLFYLAENGNQHVKDIQFQMLTRGWEKSKDQVVTSFLQKYLQIINK